MKTDHLLWEYYQWRCGSKRLFFDFLVRSEQELHDCGHEIEETESLRQYFVDLKNILRQEKNEVITQVRQLFNHEIMLAYCIFACYLNQVYSPHFILSRELNTVIFDIHNELWSLEKRLTLDPSDMVIAAVTILDSENIEFQVLRQKFPQAEELL